MINYHQAKSILKKAKIKISNEKVLVKNSINRVAAKDILSPSNHPLR
jgi:molybdopterin molybdotransferase